MSRVAASDGAEFGQRFSEPEVMAVLQENEVVLRMYDELRAWQRDCREFEDQYILSCETVGERISTLRKTRRALNGEEGGNGDTM